MNTPCQDSRMPGLSVAFNPGGLRRGSSQSGQPHPPDPSTADRSQRCSHQHCHAKPQLPTVTEIPAVSPTPSPSPTALPPDFWKKLPVIPEQVSDACVKFTRAGWPWGTTRAFSPASATAPAPPRPSWWASTATTIWGSTRSLQPAIDYFKGSFERPSLAAKAGLNSAGLLTTLWTGEQCQKNESLLDCQYRLDQPSFAIIAIGTNEAYYVHENPGSFERNMRIILDDTIAKGIVPILGTKADNVEGDDSINATIARLALEYQLPLWNFWLAVQPLPKTWHGRPGTPQFCFVCQFYRFQHSQQPGIRHADAQPDRPANAGFPAQKPGSYALVWQAAFSGARLRQ